jgi:mRNA-degrading endonuclease RelE of RelBE toxin-antitoxin system
VYRIEVAPAAERDIEKLSVRIKRKDFERIRDAITNLIQERRPQGVRTIKGAEKAYRIRVGR